MKFLTSLLLCMSLLYAIELKTNLENSNILGYQKDTKVIDYNRLRLYTDFTDERYPNIYAKIILDNENVYSFKQGKNQNRSKIYRSFINYTDTKHMFTLGLQRVPFGVGRIWNPIDVFNPIDITAIETDERKGTEALRYEYAINELSNLDITLSKKVKALRIKSFLEVADFAIVGINDEKGDIDIIGYEIEGELFGSDITIRSEGGRFKDNKRYKIYYDYIIGAEYGFENSLIILGEFHHNTDSKTKQLALNISYQPSALWIVNLLALDNLDDESFLISPSFRYSLSDESSLQIGVFAYADTSKNMVFSRYFINF